MMPTIKVIFLDMIGNRPSFVSWCDFEKYIILYIFCILLLVQTLISSFLFTLFRFKLLKVKTDYFCLLGLVFIKMKKRIFSTGYDSEIRTEQNCSGTSLVMRARMTQIQENIRAELSGWRSLTRTSQELGAYRNGVVPFRLSSINS